MKLFNETRVVQNSECSDVEIYLKDTLNTLGEVSFPTLTILPLKSYPKGY